MLYNFLSDKPSTHLVPHRLYSLCYTLHPRDYSVTTNLQALLISSVEHFAVYSVLLQVIFYLLLSEVWEI